MSRDVERFRALHGGADLLVLPNVWDALSARLVEEAGAKAVATSSAAVAWSRGYPDGEQLPLEELLRVVRDCARVVRLPITVDLERGYSDDPEAVADAVARVVEAGAVGVNLEDAAEPSAVLAAKIRAVRQRVGNAVFVNARTCVVLRGKVSSDRPVELVEEVSARARAYADASANGLFVPRLVTPEAIGEVVRSTALPLNLMLEPNLPSIPELAALGVRRLSLGPWLAEVAYGAAREVARETLAGRRARERGTELTYPEANGLFRPLS
jgi:2-methylisocitrate lyase-like PEP mutase family enzyme